MHALDFESLIADESRIRTRVRRPFFRGLANPAFRTNSPGLSRSGCCSVYGEKVKAVCAGRTDANVHATGQVIHLDTEADRKEISWVRGLNSYLPTECAVRWAKVVPDEFHARFSACSRTYEYWIVNEPVRSPILAGRTGWVFRPLNEKNMEAAGQFLVGEHDFSSFRAAGCQSKTPVKISNIFMYPVSDGLSRSVLRQMPSFTTWFAILSAVWFMSARVQEAWTGWEKSWKQRAAKPLRRLSIRPDFI